MVANYTHTNCAELSMFKEALIGAARDKLHFMDKCIGTHLLIIEVRCFIQSL